MTERTKVDVKFKDLRIAVVALNESGLIKESIRLVGVDRNVINKQFMDAVEGIPDDPETGKFPKVDPVILEYFNKMLDLEEKVAKGDAEELPAKKAEKKAPAKKAEKKAPAKKNEYGHRVGSQASLIDNCFDKGGTFEEIAKVLKKTTSRIKNHYYHMIRDKGAKFSVKVDKYKIEKS